MPELSTLLRQRLRATEDRSLRHPDADQLTAYVEELLPVDERDQILQHLARCSDCRDVVALTTPDTVSEPQPEVEVAAAVAAPAPRRRWFLSPAFGMVGSLAAVVLGVALILRLPQNTQSFNNTRTQQQVQKTGVTLAPQPTAESSVAVANTQAANAPEVANQQASSAAGRAKTESHPALVARLDNTAPAQIAIRTPKVTKTAVPAFTAESRQQDYVNRMFLANAYQTAVPSGLELPQAPAPSRTNLLFPTPSTVAGSSFQSNGAFTVPSNSPAAGQGMITVYSSPMAKGTTVMSKIVALGKHPLGSKHLGPPISSSVLGNSAMFKPDTGVAQPSDAISAAGTAGRAEAGVLAQSPAFTSNALASLPRRQMLGAPQYQWKVVQGKLLRSSDLTHWTEENPAGENLQYSVVSHDGAEIWAGGADAALVHSRDGGTTWERITLGASATGAITSIEVAGQNLQVKSSSGQSWASQDGGRSWVLQD
jgi:Photosynthesis system II assembly factor YCF48/Putative zinc-finger